MEILEDQPQGSPVLYLTVGALGALAICAGAVVGTGIWLTRVWRSALGSR